MYYRDENNEKSDTVQMWDDDIQREYKVKRDLMREREILCIWELIWYYVLERRWL